MLYNECMHLDLTNLIDQANLIALALCLGPPPIPTNPLIPSYPTPFSLSIPNPDKYHMFFFILLN